MSLYALTFLGQNLTNISFVFVFKDRMRKQLKHAQGVLPTETFLSLQSQSSTWLLLAEMKRDLIHVKGYLVGVHITPVGVYPVLYLSKLSSSRVISMNAFSLLSTAAATSFTFKLLCLPVKHGKTLNTTNQKAHVLFQCRHNLS